MSVTSQILIIYTGGTIGSFEDHATRSLRPVNFDQLRQYIPELHRIDAQLSVHTAPVPKDSSAMGPEDWVYIVDAIRENYAAYDGFVVLHGTDTMAYTASAVSFMIENLDKPVIFTGSQLPIGKIRTDGKENLITAIEIAAARREGKPLVPEVCIYFEFKLYRANRTFKFSAEHFNAYLSPNYPLLAEAGVTIEYNASAIHTPTEDEVKFHTRLSQAIGILPLFPGLTPALARNILESDGLRAVILQTYGSGNGPLTPWFLDALHAAADRGILLFNITQCRQGRVQQGYYETSREFLKMGICSGADITLEAGITKLMHLLGNYDEPEVLRRLAEHPIRGEMSVN